MGFGQLRSWAQSGTNLPIPSDIAPARARSDVVAWEWGLEHLTPKAIRPVFISMLAEECSRYNFAAKEANG